MRETLLRHLRITISELDRWEVEPKSWSERLIRARRARGLSQRKMAEWLGVDPGTIQEWETGQHRPSPTKLKLIKELLG